MRARDIAFIGSRLFAVYMLFQIVPYAVSPIHMIFDDNLDRSHFFTFEFFMSYALIPLMMAIAFFIFWDKADMVSRNLAPPETKTEEEDAQGRTDLYGVALFAVGLYCLVSAMIEAGYLVSYSMFYAPFPELDQTVEAQKEMIQSILYGLGNFIAAIGFLFFPQGIKAHIDRIRKFTTKSKTN